MEVYFFSFTGNCRKIATWIAEHFEVETYEIVAPNLPYFIWLILSFIPYLEIKCKVRPPMEDKIILCFPKWSLNCPPITYFLNNFAEERKIYMIMKEDMLNFTESLPLKGRKSQNTCLLEEDLLILFPAGSERAFP